MLDEYVKSMEHQYEQLKKHFNIQIKENMNEEMSAIKLRLCFNNPLIFSLKLDKILCS